MSLVDGTKGGGFVFYLKNASTGHRTKRIKRYIE